jgi:hypothetical protein
VCATFPNKCRVEGCDGKVSKVPGADGPPDPESALGLLVGAVTGGHYDSVLTKTDAAANTTSKDEYVHHCPAQCRGHTQRYQVLIPCSSPALVVILAPRP